MYTILIVDDEKNERDCIRFLIEKNKLPLTVLEAEDTPSALSVLNAHSVDLLFTDIQMPGQEDGLFLIKEALDRFPKLKTIIFSGYADFSYAQTAIRLGVENYILKPVVPAELISTLRSLIEQLNVKKLNEAEKDRQNTYLLRFALHLALNGNLEDAAAHDPVLLSQTGSLSSFRSMLLFQFPSDFLSLHYVGFFETVRARFGLNMEILSLSPDQIIFLIRNSSLNLRDLCCRLVEFIRTDYQSTCYISAVGPLRKYSSLKEAFLACEQLLEQHFWNPEQHIFLSELAPPEPETAPVSDDKLVAQIQNALSSKNGIRLEESLNQLFEKCRMEQNQSQVYTKFVFSNLLTILYPYLSPGNQKKVPPLSDLISELYFQPNIRQIIQSVQDVSSLIIQDFSQNKDGVRKEVAAVLDYIHQHYGEDLAIESLSSFVYLTPDYLNRLFKKETGKSLSQYIRQFRMEKAKELLMTTGLKVIEIGNMVGYSNYSYFCQSFREYYGKSPEKYRQDA